MRQRNQLGSESAVELHVKQAIIAAQHRSRHVGLLFIGGEAANTTADLNAGEDEFVDKLWARLRSILRESDAIFRTGSAQVAVLLPSLARTEDAISVAKKILGKFEKPLRCNRITVGGSIRIGVALFPEESRNARALIRHASDALTAAIRDNRPLVLYSELGYRRPSTILQMRELRQAIVEDQLFLLYQPKIRLSDGSVSGVEALARWKHPELDLIEPDEFIPVAERTGLIIPLTLWVLHQALLQCRAWIQLGINLNLAVNVSMLNLSTLELPEQIAGLLKDTGVAPQSLELEITESAIMDDAARALRTLKEIRSLGVRLAIDDFGTGYSSLAHLSRLPVTTIKIDKSFIQNMHEDRDNAVIVKSIIDLAHNLELMVVAEGVETSEARDMLVAFSCDEAQGYYFSRPVPASTLTAYFTDHVLDSKRLEVLTKEF